jgi:low temperature requirement protein LtrA
MRIGLVVMQLGWLALLALPAPRWLAGFAVLAPAELLVPIWAERRRPTTWHPHHIAERFGLLTLIVLGESVLSATTAIQAAVDGATLTPVLLAVVVGGVLVLFAMWWIYFDEPAHPLLRSSRAASPRRTPRWAAPASRAGPRSRWSRCRSGSTWRASGPW